MTLNHIEQLLNQSFIPALEQAVNIEEFYYDTRLIAKTEHALFMALTGAFRDGHHYLEEAYNLGIRYFLINENPENFKHLKGAHFLQVPHTLLAFQKIVKDYRQAFDLPIIGITGSNGKTIIKEWLYQLLHNAYHIVRSPKSYNSQLGVALSLLLIRDEHQLGIFEAGISQPNEMQFLSDLIQADMGILTNIGDAHDIHFEDRKEKLKEKLYLFKNAKTLIYCKDHEWIDQEILALNKAGFFKQKNIRFFTWGKANNSHLHIKKISKRKTLCEIDAHYLGKDYAIQIPFNDDASIENALHCLASIIVLNKDSTKILDSFKRLGTVKMRLERVEGGRNTIIINDSYNSDLASVNIALNHLSQQDQYHKKTVILSDINQAFSNEKEAYQQVADWLKALPIQRFIGIGLDLKKAKSHFENIPNLAAHFYDTTDEFISDIYDYQFEEEYILLKGSRKFSLEKIKKILELKLHRTHLEIDLEAIKHNFLSFKSLLKPVTKIMGMVKAHGYGGGSLEVAQTLQNAGADYLAVAYIDEGIQLKLSGIKLPIMVMNPDLHSLDRMIAWNLEPEIYNLAILKAFTNQLKNQGIKDYPIHIKIDTGMHRLGFMKEDLKNLLSFLKKHQSYLKIQSIFSHLVASDQMAFDDFTNKQYANFQNAIDALKEVLAPHTIQHILNSTGIIRHTDYQLDMVRLGIGLYGIDPSNTIAKRLEKAISLKTTIAMIKSLKKGEGIGYNLSNVLERDSIIATVNIGYADGFLRRFGQGKAYMSVNGQRAPIIGNVAMDMTMIDITGIEGVAEGDEIEVFGDHIAVEELADWAETIPYEILTNISDRVPRVYVQSF